MNTMKTDNRAAYARRKLNNSPRPHSGLFALAAQGKVKRGHFAPTLFFVTGTDDKVALTTGLDHSLIVSDKYPAVTAHDLSLVAGLIDQARGYE